MTVPEMNAFLRGILKDYPTLHVIDGPSLVPHVFEFYTDGAHPTEACFAFYASNFYAAIQKELK